MKDGKQLSPGSRGLPRDLILYDFQLRTVADSFRGLTSIDDFASLLSSAGKHVDPVLVRQTLLRGVQAAVQRQSSPASTVGLLVRELGLHHRPGTFGRRRRG
jgi:hypothetical protein